MLRRTGEVSVYVAYISGSSGYMNIFKYWSDLFPYKNRSQLVSAAPQLHFTFVCIDVSVFVCVV